MNRLFWLSIQLFSGKMKILSPKILIRDSFISIIPFYKLCLVFWIPWLISSLLTFFIPQNFWLIIELLRSLSLGTILWGAIIYFNYKKINQEKVTILQSFKKGIEKFLELLFLAILRYILFYSIFPRLYFVDYLVVVENYPVTDAFKRCWKMTKGCGWQIFCNFITIRILYGMLSFLSSLIISAIFGVSVWELIRQKFLMAEPAFAIDRLLTFTIYFFVGNPLGYVYRTLMFIRIRNLNLDKKNLDHDTMLPIFETQ